MRSLGISEFPCIHEAGPLDEKSQRLVKRAISIGVGQEGATQSAVRNAYTAGNTQEEIDRVTPLAVSNLGMPALVTSHRIKVKLNY
jgi:alkylhydroperoxidase/carboxymuconolactone decarboxylase family protein YurZ